MIKIKSALELANIIDHTNLSNVATKSDIEHLCKQAKHYNFYSVVVAPYYIKYVKNLLNSSSTKLCTVIGFPLGFVTPKTKEKEVKIAIKRGIDEVDMVINISALKSGDWETIIKEVEKVKSIARNKILKVIIEAELLTKEEIIKVCKIANDGEADYIKTSTGLSGLSPKIANINLIKKTVPKMKVKASGGIKNYKTAFSLIAAGADRIGTSSGDLIIEEYKNIYENLID
ncbi:MAG: deoxyribose-phosphate aldolase [Methanobacteriaceae archaeon]|jgi:deoxyribose-phosphate aldolase|nr:deoxyribose-phosphate aldolase [Candidatus Methanorudis spinitermitis]